MTKMDLAQLRIEIQRMRRTHVLYGVLKEELSGLGYWKNKARGDPVKAYAARGKRLVG